jgi:hypothetical protein
MPRCVLPAFAILCALAGPAKAAVWYVNNSIQPAARDGTSWQTAFDSIQQALDAARPGDEVWAVAGNTGSYRENVTFVRPDVGLYGGFDGGEKERSDRLAGWRSFLVAPPLGPVIWIPPGASGCVVDGFDVSGALNDSGIRVEADSVTLSHNVIHDNVCSKGPEFNDSWGGGIYCTGAGAVITDNGIHDNRARGGGGMYVWSDNARVERNIVQDNIADNIGLQEPWDGCGGGLLLRGTLLRIRNNVIARNTAVRYTTAASTHPAPAQGGGVFGYGDFNLTNNTIADNRVFGSDGATGGGVCTANGTMVLASNVLSGNLAGSGSGDAHGGGFYSPRDIESPATLEFRANYFSGNAPEDGVPPDTDTRFGSPPQFVSETVYHLLPTSPLIDYGSNADVESGERDADSAPRVIGPRVDVGAYESPISYAPPTLDRAYVRPDGHDTADGGSWATARQTVGSAISVTKEGGAVWVATGTYLENVTLKPGLSLYGGFAGTETDIRQRDFRSHPSILDGGRKGTVVTIPEEAVAATVDGLTIRRGVFVGYGGGVNCAASNVTLVNNVIEDNIIFGGGAGAPQWVTGTGGGAQMSGDAPIVANNTFRRNRVVSIGYGGGAAHAFGEAHGGGLMITAPVAVVVNNLFAGNEASAGAYDGAGYASGAGLYPVLQGGIVANNTFADNIAEGSYSGGTAPSGGASSPHLANNIVAFNEGSVLAGPGWAHFDHNLVFANVGDEPSGESPVGRDDNIAVDPMFANRAGEDYRLQPGSPAIDAGDSSAAFTALDLDGHPRVQGAAVDIGAYEWMPGGPVTVGDAAAALRIAAGLSAATPDLMPRLNVDHPGSPRIDLADVAALLRESTQ